MWASACDIQFKRLRSREADIMIRFLPEYYWNGGPNELAFAFYPVTAGIFEHEGDISFNDRYTWLEGKTRKDGGK